MNKPLQSLFMLCLSVMLLACDKDADHQNKSKAYDYRDERHQDFYSRYMRKTQKDYLIIKSRDMHEKLGVENIPENALARMNLTRVNPAEQKNSSVNNIQSKAELLALYNQNGNKYQPCAEKDEEENFFCLSSLKFPNRSFKYFYIPSESIKIKHIAQVISFSCSMIEGEKRCIIFNDFNSPFNLSLSIHFTDIQNFFYLIPYIEQHFYETTGEHVWENAPPPHASAAQ